MKKLALFFLCVFSFFSCQMVQEVSPSVTGEVAEPFYIQADKDAITVSVRQLQIALIVPSFVYSIDGGKEWRAVNLTTEDSSTWRREIQPGQKVYIKAREGEPNPNLTGKLLFKSTGICLIGGNIMSLLNSDPEVYGKIKSIPENAFVGIFSNFDGLKDASKLILPVDKLSTNCYSTLFANCQDLEIPPALPAKILDESCYSMMFLNCKNLKVAPALNSTSIQPKCYRSMFSGCTSLKETPALPAKYLADQCYQDMFNGCSGLETICDLPAQTLGANCYYGMFQDCTGIKTVPDGPEKTLLPATAMHKYCYANMFSGCINLENAPRLMSTRLSEGCYSGMFYNCRKITNFSLPAKDLQNKCYERMFTGCSELKRITVEFDEWKDSSTNEWVKGVFNPKTEEDVKKTTFYAPDNLMNITGINAIPERWIIEPSRDEAEEQMPQVEVEPGTLSEPLYFESATSQPFTIKIVANSAFRDKLNLLPKLRYSTNGTNWNNCTITDLENTTFSQYVESGKLYISAQEDQKTIDGIHFVSDKNVSVGGNIMSLLSPTGFSNVTKVNTSSFQNLFKGFEKLVDAKNLVLPSTELATSCYSGMFSNCENLVTPPIIFTANLQPNCYSQMFSGCKSLASAPKLNSVVLSSYCYSEMFKGCEALTTPPELPAKYIAIGCYNQMFEDCKALTSAPELKANIMLESCYYKMFKGCENLSAPPAMYTYTQDKDTGKLDVVVVLANLCYSYMFADCYNLKTAPDLPATELQVGCYAAMFMGCRELKKAPVLPAESLVSTCYISMFKDCRKLEEVEARFTSWNTQSTADWMSGAGSNSSSRTFKCYKPLLIPNEDDFEYSVDKITDNWDIIDITY